MCMYSVGYIDLNDHIWKLTEEWASSVDLTDPVTVAWTCQTVQLMVNGHHGVLSQTWEKVKK